ncbi:hypothetical protein FRB97_008934 [Tulasnella sp. 331]|nr:hypothetical protein FRB97_008934 [Tulasnella sp. 331]
MDPCIIPSDEITVDNLAPASAADNSSPALKGVWKQAAVAVKRLPQDTTLQGVTDFVRKYQAIQHENVLKLFGASAFQPGPTICLIAPYLESGNVMNYLGAHPDVSPLKLCLEAAIGMEYLHSMRVIHGRLKPTNILVSEDGRACITDPGLYQFSGVPAAASYLSPESWKGKVSKQSDVYAFAICMYEMYIQGPPWGFLSDTQVYQLVVREGERPDRPDEDVNHPLRDHEWGIVESAWNVNPATRPTFKQIVERLSAEPQPAAVTPALQPQTTILPTARQPTPVSPPPAGSAAAEVESYGLSEAEAELGALSLSPAPPAYDSAPPTNMIPPQPNAVHRPAPIITYDPQQMPSMAMGSRSQQIIYTPPPAQSVFIPPQSGASYYPDEKRRPLPGADLMQTAGSGSSMGYPNQQQEGRRLPQAPSSAQSSPGMVGMGGMGRNSPAVSYMMGTPISTPAPSEDRFSINQPLQQQYYAVSSEMGLASPQPQRFSAIPSRPMMDQQQPQQQMLSRSDTFHVQQGPAMMVTPDRRMSLPQGGPQMIDARMASTPPPMPYQNQYQNPQQQQQQQQYQQVPVQPQDPRMSVSMTSPQPHLQRFNSTATRPMNGGMGGQSSYAPSVMSGTGSIPGSSYYPDASTASSATAYAAQAMGQLNPMSGQTLNGKQSAPSTVSSGLGNPVNIALALQVEMAEGRKREVIDEYLIRTQELVCQSEKEAQKFVTAGIIPTLILLVKTRAADTSGRPEGTGLELVLKTLGLLAHDSVSANTIFRTNTAIILFEIIALSGNQDATALAIWCLSRMSRNAEIASGLIKNDLVSLLLRNGLTGAPPLAQISAWCLGNLVYTDPQADTLASQSAITAVVAQLRKLLDSRVAQPDDICAVLYAIGRISRSIKLAKLLHRAGCVEPLVSCFSTSEDPDVLMWCARAIGCLMRPNSGDMAKILLEAGSAAALARLPQVIPSDSIAPLGAFAFAIARFSCAEWGSSTRKQLVEAGVVDSLLAALRTAADVPYPEVHIQLALAVSFLGDVGGGDLRKEIVRAGGIEILKQVGARGNPQVAKTCSMAVTSITGNLWTRNAASAKTAMSHDWSGGCPDHQPPCPTTSNNLHIIQAPAT